MAAVMVAAAQPTGDDQVSIWFYVFAVLAALAWIGVFINAQKQRATRMVYSLLMVAIWSALALLSGGYIG
jgi:hypothetical protein